MNLSSTNIIHCKIMGNKWETFVEIVSLFVLQIERSFFRREYIIQGTECRNSIPYDTFVYIFTRNQGN